MADFTALSIFSSMKYLCQGHHKHRAFFHFHHEPFRYELPGDRIWRLEPEFRQGNGFKGSSSTAPSRDSLSREGRISSHVVGDCSTSPIFDLRVLIPFSAMCESWVLNFRLRSSSRFSLIRIFSFVCHFPPFWHFL